MPDTRREHTNFFSTIQNQLSRRRNLTNRFRAGNIKELKKHMSAQTIGHDKLNQLRHVRFFKTPENIRIHMEKLAEELRPKFDMVLDKLEQNLSGTGLASWSTPRGGYFVSLDTLPGCAKRTVDLARAAGVTLTEAGATYPYGKDPKDSNIRIAPSFASAEEIEPAARLFTICVRLATLEKLTTTRFASETALGAERIA